MSPKIILLDIDGTLVDYENQLPDSAIHAVREARQQGHKVYICTGRTTTQIDPRIRDIGFDGFIAGNGNYIESDGHTIFYETLPADTERAVVDWLNARTIPFFVETNNGVFSSESFEREGPIIAQKYNERFSNNRDVKVSTLDVFPFLVFGQNMYRPDVNKVSFFLSRYQDFEDAKEAFPDLKAGTWGGWGQQALFGELGIAGVSKGTGAQKLFEYLETDKEDTVAFGDALQDIPMMQASGCGVALGNACDETKAAADHVTEPVQEDGLYNAFVRLGFI